MWKDTVKLDCSLSYINVQVVGAHDKRQSDLTLIGSLAMI